MKAWALDPLGQTQFSTALKSFSQIQKKSGPCLPGADATCPSVLSNLVQQDKKNSFGGLLESQYNTCRKYLRSDQDNQAFPSSKDLALHFAQYEGAGLGANVHSQIQRCLSSDDTQAKENISKYYYYFNRLEKAQNAQLEAMAGIDLVLGLNPITDISCRDISLQAAQESCQQIKKSCQPQQGLQELSTRSTEAKTQIAELETQKKKIEMQAHAKGPLFLKSENGQKQAAQVQALEFMIQTLRSQNAWLDGPDYQKAIKSGKSESASIAIQLKKNRSEIQKNYMEGLQAQACLAGSSQKSCSPESIRAAIEKTPLAPDRISTKNGSSKARSLAAGEYLSMQQCAHQATVDREATGKVLQSATLDAVLAGATLGLGALYAAPKALISARSLAVAKYAKLADQGFNAGYFAASLTEAGKQCLSDQREIASAPASSSAKKCDVKNVYEGAQAIEAYDSCVSSALWAGLDGLPFASGFLQKSLRARTLAGTASGNMAKASEANLLVNRGAEQGEILKATGSLNDTLDGGKARLALAEGVLGREISAEESKWIMQAHEKHGDKTYRVKKDNSAGELSVADLRDKLKNRPATLDAKDARKLVESGILGSSTASAAPQRLKAEKTLLNGIEKRNKGIIEEGWQSGRDYYLKLAAKPEELKADWRGANEIMQANTKGLKTKESADLFDQFLTRNKADIAPNYRSMIGQLTEEITRLENLKSMDLEWKNYQLWRAQELRYELMERYYTRKYTDKFNDIDLDKMQDRELNLRQKAREQLDKSRDKAAKAGWPGL